jgi:hypothetical protein
MYFGEVVEEGVVLSASGEIAAGEWLKTPRIRTNVRLDEFIVMPNHLHGILIIEHKVHSPSEKKPSPYTVEKTRSPPARGARQ